jgi:class 3 adenylate cyclase
VKRVWILAAFGDIRGYRRWCRNHSVTQEVRRPFLRKFFREVDRFCRSWNCQVKRLGDGFIIFFEVPYKKQKAVCLYKMLVGLRDLTSNIFELLENCPWPPPYGFRIRIPGGWVDRHMVADLNNPGKRLPEYIGESPNLARELLYVRPSIEVMTHSSVIRRLDREHIRSLGAKRLRMRGKTRGIDVEDLGQLWEIPLKKEGRLYGRRRKA